MDELITRHSAIMNTYDPDKRVALIVDEWGTWYNVEPGTNPGFLYQQNTIRDALVAGINLNLFHHHSDRVRMANIAQVVNVLQAVILTEGADMLLTPTYHVFDMYKVHQDASYIATEAVSPSYEMDGKQIDQLSASASLNADNQLHISLCNLHHAESLEVQCDIKGHFGGTISGLVITSDTMDAHNTFDEPNAVNSQPFTDYRVENDVLLVTLPARSVVTLCLA